MEVLDRYLYQVGRHLPRKDKEDTLNELRSLILEEFDVKVAKGEAEEKALLDTIKGHGDPYTVAFKYRTDNPLIRRELEFVMWMVIRIIAIVIPLGILIAKTVEFITSNDSFTLAKAHTIWPFFNEPAVCISISPAATYSAQWSETEKRWLLEHNNNPNIAESGVHLGPSTLIIQMVSITPSEYKDKLGGVTPLSQTVGSGKAYVLRNGELFATTWNRPFADSGTTFTLNNGEQMNFAPGQIWIALTDREPDFTSRPTSKTK